MVSSPVWNNGTILNAGAVTWAMALRASQASLPHPTAWSVRQLATMSHIRVTALSNGNFVVSSYFWKKGTVGYAGAVTWGNGTTGIMGDVSLATVWSYDEPQILLVWVESPH